MINKTQISDSKVNWSIINWMRGLAALYVVINHARGNLFTDTTHYAAHVASEEQWHWWEIISFKLMQHADLGTEFVILFFILSGFSIAHSLNSNQKNIQFYLRRAVRLYPAYLLGLLWAFVVFIIIKNDASAVFYKNIEGHEPLKNFYDKFIALKSVISNILYVPKDNFLTPQYWSLPFEVIFYLIAPWAVRNLRSYGLPAVLLYIAGWIWMGKAYFDDEKDSILLQFLTDYNIYFLTGILFYTYRDKLIKFYTIGKMLSITLLAVLFETLVALKSYVFQQQSNKITGIIMVMFTFILLFSGLKYNIKIWWLEFIGIFSYTLYVTHYASIYLVKMLFFRLGFHFYDIYQLYAWYIGIVVSLILAYGLYYLAEYPGIKYLSKLRKKAIPA